MAFLRAQSALEYLMTYGWAILIIGVVLGALFSLGIFSSPVTACLPVSGYECSSYALNTGELLGFTLVQTATATMYNVQIACSATQGSTGLPSNIMAFSWLYANGLAFPENTL